MPTADKPAGRGCCCEELWKKDTDTLTPISVTKLTGCPLHSIMLYWLWGKIPGERNKKKALPFV